jgi:hypothetical protein
MSETNERNRRWTLALGVDSDAESGFMATAMMRRRRAAAVSADRRRASRNGWVTSANFSPHPWCR